MYQLLRFINYKDLENWSVKNYIANLVHSKYSIAQLKDYIQEEKEKINPLEYPEKNFKILGVNNKIGIFDNEIKKSSEINQSYKIVKDGFLAFNPYRVNVGSIGLKTNEQNYNFISPAYVVFSCNQHLLSKYLLLIFKTNTFNQIIRENTRGTVRQILAFDILKNLKIPLPELHIQNKLLENYQSKITLAEQQEKEAIKKEQEIEEYLYRELGIERVEEKEEEKKVLLRFVRMRDLGRSWSYHDLFDDKKIITSNKFEITNFKKKEILFKYIFRGKSPKYRDKSSSIILNQKCNRWNRIELKYSKSIDDEWFRRIDDKFLTQENDIIINSTGDGTIGRATFINKDFENLFYDSHILLLRININKINTLFFTYFINSTLGQKQIENIKSATSTKQTELGVNNLQNIYFPLPPLQTQTYIANHIQTLKDEIKTLKQQAIENREKAIGDFEKEVFRVD